MIYLKALGLWLALLVVAILVATVREKIIVPQFGDLAGHQIGTLVVVALFFVAIYFFVLGTEPTATEALLIGLMMVSMTIIFEFIFGHYVMKNPWSKLLADYNILKGRIWLLVLITIALGPWVVRRLID